MTSTTSPTILWFRDDLRLQDHPALTAALASGSPVHCVFIHEPAPQTKLRPLGGASKWFLHHALAALSDSLSKIGGRLDIYNGLALDIIPAIVKASGASTVHASRRYERREAAQDKAIANALKALGVAFTLHHGHLLYEPEAVRNLSGEPFRVFTPFWRAARAYAEPSLPLPAPKTMTAARFPTGDCPAPAALATLTLLPTKPDWAGGLRAQWSGDFAPSEDGARRQLDTFLSHGLARYHTHRDRPDLPTTSKLAPQLRFGTLSIRTAFHAAEHAAKRGLAEGRAVEKFQAELGWREFSYHLLGQFPDLATRNFNARFDAFPWHTPRQEDLTRWQHGQTGYPIVDAGMRELWQTGFMHNRVRMIVASFLVKDLLIPWQTGESWFWDTLCDADHANNAASWQWVAGSGADAAPYFRVFNPILQGEKFDPEGAYVRRFVPELARLPDNFIHKPWLAPPLMLADAGVNLGKTYPEPMVDHAQARTRALQAFAALSA